MKKCGISVLLSLLVTSLSIAAPNQTAPKPLSQRKDVRIFINKTAKKYHLDKNQLQKELDHAKVLQKIIEAMNRPAEKKPWNEYQTLFVTPKRVQQGVDFWKANEDTLNKAEKQYGVSIPMIVAILGVETNYGEHQGHFKVLDALTTLAFHYPKRQKYFTRELAQFFALCKEQGIKPDSVYGSYAGAIGQPQFMPSSYRHYAVDFSGNGKKDLRTDTQDAIGSVANYFKIHGWKNAQEVADRAMVDGVRYRQLKINPRRARYSLNKLKSYGVKTQENRIAKKASLVALRKTNGTDFWVAYPNFFVITRYNTSKQYAMAVHLLAQQIEDLKQKENKSNNKKMA